MAKMEEKSSAPEPKQVEVESAPPSPGSKEINKEARTFAMLAHLLAIFTSFLGPLVIWLIKKDEHPFVDEQGKEALNFQITVAIAYVVSGLMVFVCIGFVLLSVVWVVDLIFCIMACVKVNNGEHYRYPINIRFIK